VLFFARWFLATRWAAESKKRKAREILIPQRVRSKKLTWEQSPEAGGRAKAVTKVEASILLPEV
jgi:hypothetical protein